MNNGMPAKAVSALLETVKKIPSDAKDDDEVVMDIVLSGITVKEWRDFLQHHKDAETWNRFAGYKSPERKHLIPTFCS